MFLFLFFYLSLKAIVLSVETTYLSLIGIQLSLDTNQQAIHFSLKEPKLSLKTNNCSVSIITLTPFHV